MSKISVTIKNGDEGFYGSENHDNINHAESVAEYEKLVTAAIRKTYSAKELEIEMVYGSYAGRSVIVSGDDLSECENVEDLVNDAVERVYNLGAFWVENAK